VIREPEKETTVILRPKRIPSRRGLWSLGAVFLIAAAASLGLAACGGDDNGDGTSTSAATTSGGAATGGQAQTVKIGETEYKLDPSDPSVKAGTVTFDVSNDGKVAHSLEVEGPNGEDQLPSDLQPGDSGKLQVDLSKPGKYEFYCPVDDHKGLGMEGEITVE
jgi:uncharacterized cupredoxin-like copper-binding protein